MLLNLTLVNSVNDNPGTASTSGNVINIPAPTDGYWTFREIPLFSNIRVGLQKEPIGFEHVTSSRYLDFLERSFNQDAYTGPFNNGFTPGVSTFQNYGEDDRGLVHVGVFKNTVNPFSYGLDDGGYAVDGRVTYLLLDEDGGDQLIHIGGAYSFRDPIKDTLRIRSRGSLRNGPGPLNPVFADSGTLTVDNQHLFATEMAFIYGSFQLQSEFISSIATNSINGAGNHGSYLTNGYYLMASYFLTGEHREYDKKSAAFGRIIPHRNSRWFPDEDSECGYGAWQLLARYSNLDLSDSGINGGRVHDYTAGVNWFLNPNMKIQANYVFTDRNSLGSPTAPGEGGIHGFGMRLAHDF